jgi:hypothetical protein
VLQLDEPLQLELHRHELLELLWLDGGHGSLGGVYAGCCMIVATSASIWSRRRWRSVVLPLFTGAGRAISPRPVPLVR